MAKKKQIKITQVKSIIGSKEKQKQTIRALGLRRLNHTVIHQETPQILGMINKVSHLVNVESV